MGCLLVFSPWAGFWQTKAQSGDRYGSGTLHSGQVLRGSSPLLSPAFRRSHFGRQMPPRHQRPLGKARYPLYRRLGGPQSRSGRVRKISPLPGFDPRIVQPVVIRCWNILYRAYNLAKFVITTSFLTRSNSGRLKHEKPIIIFPSSNFCQWSTTI
jgi:hypothetical protein